MNDTPKPKPPIKRPTPVKPYEPPKWYPLRGHEGLTEVRRAMVGGVTYAPVTVEPNPPMTREVLSTLFEPIPYKDPLM